MKTTNNILIIGAGGVGSWLTPAICKLVGCDCVTVMDGDVLEDGNLDRQLFSPDEIGENKSLALARRYGCKADARFFTATTRKHSMRDWLMVCADNNAARLAALENADRYGCNVIIGANETRSAEAYFYTPTGERNRDPRVYIPELLTPDGNDPVARRAGCTGRAQEGNPQLVSANFMAAALMLHLFTLWAMDAGRLTRETRDVLPFRFRANQTRLETIHP